VLILTFVANPFGSTAVEIIRDTWENRRNISDPSYLELDPNDFENRASYLAEGDFVLYLADSEYQDEDSSEGKSEE
jgi:hypothetical protein